MERSLPASVPLKLSDIICFCWQNDPKFVISFGESYKCCVEAMKINSLREPPGQSDDLSERYGQLSRNFFQQDKRLGPMCAITDGYRKPIHWIQQHWNGNCWNKSIASTIMTARKACSSSCTHDIVKNTKRDTMPEYVRSVLVAQLAFDGQSVNLAKLPSFDERFMQKSKSPS